MEIRHHDELREEDEVLSQELGKAHELLFTDQDRKPAWKLIVVIHGGEGRRTIDIIYLSQHAIADGLSCVAFHKSLYNYLLEGLSLPRLDLLAEWPYIVPSNTAVLHPVEDFLTVTPSSPSTTETDKLEIWTGPPPYLPSTTTYGSRVHILTIPTTSVREIQEGSRTLHTTVTSILHALTVTYLSHAVPTSDTFTGVTPYSLRPFTGVTKDEIVNYIGYIVSTWKPETVSSIRKAKAGSPEEFHASMLIGKQFREEIEAELKTVSAADGGGPTILRELAAVTDHMAAGRAALSSGKRGGTYELSNVGVADFGAGNEDLRLEKLVFSQCGMVTGPVIGLSVVSVKEGPLVITIGWQDGALEEEFVKGLATFLKERLIKLGC